MKKLLFIGLLFVSLTSFGQLNKTLLRRMIDRDIKANGSYSSFKMGKLLDSLVYSTPSQLLTAGHFYVGNASDTASSVALSGDGTLSSGGSLTVTKIQGRTVTSSSPSTGQILKWNGTSWALASDSSAAGTVTSVSGTTNRITSTGGTTPAIDISASYVGQSSITTLGTIGTGTWNGSVIPGQYGGTGVNNSGKTITIGGNLTTTGAFNTTLAVAGSNTITFPNASITVARTDAAQTFTGIHTFSSSPIVPTPSAGTNNTQAASTAFVVNSFLNNDPTTYANHGAFDGSELFWVNQVGVNKYTTLNDLLRYIQDQPSVEITSSDTLDLTYLSKNTFFISASTIIVTIPSNTFQAGQTLLFTRGGAGTVTFNTDSTRITVYKAGASYDMSDQWTASALYFKTDSTAILYQGINSGGDVITNGSVANLDIPVFDGTSGNQLKTSAVKMADLHLASNKASASDINTGTDNDKRVTALAIAGSRIVGQNGSKLRILTSGTNTYTGGTVPTLTAYKHGQQFNVTFINGNSASSTLNVDALGAITLKKWSSGSLGNLASGDLPAGIELPIRYDSINTCFQVQPPPSASGSRIYTIPFMFLQVSFADATTRYFGAISLQPSATEGVQSKIHIPVAGTITGVEFHTWSSVVGTNESWTMYLRLNNSSDITLQTLSDTNAEKDWSNLSLSQAVSVGDYVEGKTITPTWATNPTLTSGYGLITITLP